MIGYRCGNCGSWSESITGCACIEMQVKAIAERAKPAGIEKELTEVPVSECYNCVSCGFQNPKTQAICVSCKHFNHYSVRHANLVEKEKQKSKLTEATKDDSGKLTYSLIPVEALNPMTEALMYGAKKYERDNYKKGIEWTRLIDAALRHIIAFKEHEEYDPESGVSHIGHALASLAMLSYNASNWPEKDDR